MRLLSRTGLKAAIAWSRQIAIHLYVTSHSDNFQIIYLPRARLLIGADHVSPREGWSMQAGELSGQLLKGIERLYLNMQTIIGIH